MPRNKKANLTEATLLGILLNKDCYGREILAEFEKRTRRRMPLGSLYVLLDRMEQAGFLTSRWGESTHERGGNRRKYYHITGSGVRAFNEASVGLREPERA